LTRHQAVQALSRVRADRVDCEVAVIMVDLDHVKVVDDIFGRAVGDELLRRLGALLRGVTRQDDLAVRLGGDEVLVLCHITSEREILTQATGLVSGIAAHGWHEPADGHRYRAESNGRAWLMHDSSAPTTAQPLSLVSPEGVSSGLRRPWVRSR
jgi:diguanylate cyclase (GGDEF)-like protein